MTPQDIRERALEKTMFGGYDMAAVDKFREEVAIELAASQKEIAVLKGKMKVLVDKIEEYRATEDAMRLALLSAQKIGKQIEEDAQKRADEIITSANTQAEKVLGGLRQAKADEEEKLLAAKTSCAKFLEEARALSLTQLNYLDTLTTAKQKETPVQQAAPVQQPEVHETIRSIDDSVAQITEETAPEIDITPAMESNQPATADAADEATQLYNFLHNS